MIREEEEHQQIILQEEEVLRLQRLELENQQVIQLHQELDFQELQNYHMRQELKNLEQEVRIMKIIFGF